MLPFEDCIQAGISVFNNLLLYPGLAPSVGLMVTVFCRGQHQMRSYSVFWGKKNRSDLQLQKPKSKIIKRLPIDIN